MTKREFFDDIFEMLKNVTAMSDNILEGFMKNKIEFINESLNNEARINELEKKLTKAILSYSKTVKDGKEKKELAGTEQIVETLERVGDELASLAERVQIKIEEKLYFSDIGVSEYQGLYNSVRESIKMTFDLVKTNDKSLVEKIVSNGFKCKELVEEYREEHTDRLIKGICNPRAANIYFDMLDFAGNVARHCSNIAKVI